MIFQQQDEIKWYSGQRGEELTVLILINSRFRIKNGFRIGKVFLSVLLVCRLNNTSLLSGIYTWLRYTFHTLEG